MVCLLPTELTMIAAVLPTLKSLRITDYGEEFPIEVPNLLNPSSLDWVPQGILPLYEIVSGDRGFPHNSLLHSRRSPRPSRGNPSATKLRARVSLHTARGRLHDI